MKVGVIGAGAIALPHLWGYQRVEAVKGVLVADTDEGARRRIQGEFPSARLCADYREIIRDDDVELVDVCLPHYLHCPVTLEALRAGKDVICEKPMAMSLREADSMMEAAEKAGRRLFVSLNQMFAPAHRRARELVAEGALGRLLLGSWRMIGDAFDVMNDRDHWKGSLDKAGGGALIDTGTHAAYVMISLFGRPRMTAAFTRRLLVEHENKSDDNSVAIIEFESGAVVTLAETYTARSESWNERKDVYGSEASLHIDDTSRDAPLTMCTRERRMPEVVPVETPAGLWEETVARSVVHHVQVRQGAATPLYPTSLARDSLALLLACYESSRTGRAIRL